MTLTLATALFAFVSYVWLLLRWPCKSAGDSRALPLGGGPGLPRSLIGFRGDVLYNSTNTRERSPFLANHEHTFTPCKILLMANL